MNAKTKKIGITIGVLIFLVIILIGIFISKFNSSINNPLRLESEEVILIEEGESFYDVLDNLDSEGKIDNKFFVKLYIKLKNLDVVLSPGKFKLNKDMDVNEILNTFNDVGEQITLTIPEGFNIEEIAKRIEEVGICESSGFIKAVEAYKLPEYISDKKEKKYNLEGFLFPDTYIIPHNYSATDVIEMMINQFKSVFDSLTDELNIKIDNKNIESVVNIASMIEKEARLDKERALISSVIYNRLDIDMPLQFCSTVIYAHGYHLPQVLYSHLEIDSKFNTYKNVGLPPGPISSPGIESIKAALNPEKTDYLYYLLESDEDHYFTDNYEDFLKRKEELGYDN